MECRNNCAPNISGHQSLCDLYATDFTGVDLSCVSRHLGGSNVGRSPERTVLYAPTEDR